MNKNRLEAFSDAVFAIIITIMVLEFKVPHGGHWSSLLPLLPVFICYVLSFLYVGIYWSNHHHTLQATKTISSGVLWANLHLLFWLSLLPFSTGWMGENGFAQEPTILYGFNLLMAAFSYRIFVIALVNHHGKVSKLALAFGIDLKGKCSLALYALGLALTFVTPLMGIVFYFAVALMWLTPDKRLQLAYE